MASSISKRRAAARRKKKIRRAACIGVLALIILVGVILIATAGKKEPAPVDYQVRETAVPVSVQTPEDETAEPEEPVQQEQPEIEEPAAEQPAAEEPAAQDETAAELPTESGAAGQAEAVDTIVAFQNEKQAGTGLRSARIRSIGDFVIHEQLYTQAKVLGKQTGAYKYDFSPMLTYIKPYFEDADYTVANVDGPMGGKGDRGYASYPQFNTPEDLIPILKEHGVDMLTLANNHALDTYYDGLKAEIKNVQAAGLDYVGAALSEKEHNTPVIKEINGIRIGFLNYTTTANTMENYCSKDAVNFGMNLITSKTSFSKDVKAAREAGAEVVVAYMHWGKEYERTPNSDQRTYAKKLARAGCDVIIGSHPHVVQPTYWISTQQEDGTEHKCLCVCSIGNFISNQRKTVNKKGEVSLEYTDAGILFDFTIQETSSGVFEIAAPSYIPVYVWRTEEGDGFMYRVLPIGDYYAERPEGMADEDYFRMQEAYGEIVDWMGTSIRTINGN